MKLYCVNLYSLNCIDSAIVYSETFNLDIIHSAIQHSELITKEGLKVIFSKPSENCKPIPGSITFLSDSLEQKFNEEHFSIQSVHSKYISLLDIYKNLIWIYKI